MRRGLLIVQSAALAAVMMCPTPGTPGARALGSADADTAKHLWNLWWMRTELLSGEPGLGTRLVNFPDGAALYPIDPLDGLVGFFLPIPAVSLANVLCFVHLTLLGMAAGWLGRMVSGSRLGGYVAAALAQGSAFAAFTVHVGVGELRQFWWLPLGLGCLLRARETGAWSWFVRLGLVGGFATLACFYYGAFLGLASVTILAVDLVVQRPVPSLRTLRGHGLALAIAAAIAVPAASAFASSYGPSTTVAATPTTTAAVTVADASGAAAALEDLYLPRAWARSELDDDARAYTGGR
ncbi:MAG: hypothetical protein FJ090_07385, partial [Deltaproteobacteria bacterium]|nr:hypothetical protein [Deltaproteobacteria bacterium]